MYACTCCQRELSTEPDKSCMFCFFTGRYFEMELLSEGRSFMLQRIRDMENVVAADVWHHDQGNFLLCIGLRDGRVVYAGVKVRMMQVSVTPEGTEEKIEEWVMPHIPPVDGTWGLAVLQPGGLGAPEFDPSMFVVMPDVFEGDDALVTAIEQVATFNELLES